MLYFDGYAVLCVYIFETDKQMQDEKPFSKIVDFVLNSRPDPIGDLLDVRS